MAQDPSRYRESLENNSNCEYGLSALPYTLSSQINELVELTTL